MRYLALLVTLPLLALACYYAASDAQGAVVFFVFYPAILAVWLLVLRQERRRGKASPLTLGALAFLVLFLVTAFTPGPSLPGLCIRVVAEGFEALTGETPYARTRRQGDVRGQLEKLVQSGRRPIEFSALETALSWERVCIFSPYTTDDHAREILGFDWQLSLYSQIGSSDRVTTLVFADQKRVAYVVDYSREEYDFAKLGGQCLARDAARFE
jgi:hypothetical protein